VNIYNIVNKFLGVRKNIVKIRFSIGDRLYEAYVPDDEYWGSIKDILLNREYEHISLFSIENLKGFTVIDVGAHVGLYSLAVSGYAYRVISIEPHPINYRLLEINRIMNDIEQMIALNVAVVGVKCDNVKLYAGDHSGGHSIAIKSSSKWYRVQALTLDDIIKNYATDDKVLLKVDIEGAEFEVFKSIDLNTLKNIRRIVMEIHLGHGSLDTIVNKLKEAGFTTKYFYPPLITRDAKPPIKVYDLTRLKTLRFVIYSLTSLYGLKDRDLIILYAWR